MPRTNIPVEPIYAVYQDRMLGRSSTMSSIFDAVKSVRYDMDDDTLSSSRGYIQVFRKPFEVAFVGRAHESYVLQ